MTPILIGLATAVAISLAASVVLLLAARPPGLSVAESLRVLPQAFRLSAAVYRDRSLPRSVRRRLRLALIYNLQPINLIPDFVPVIGVADNLAALVWALRSTVRVAGPEAVERHWTGSPAALEGLYRALRLPRHPSTVRT